MPAGHLWYLCARVCVSASGRTGNTNGLYSRCQRVIVVVVRRSPTSNCNNNTVHSIILLFILYVGTYLSTMALSRHTLERGIRICSASACTVFEIVFVIACYIVYLQDNNLSCASSDLNRSNPSRFDDHVDRSTQHRDWYMKRYLTTNRPNLRQVIL